MGNLTFTKPVRNQVWISEFVTTNNFWRYAEPFRPLERERIRVIAQEQADSNGRMVPEMPEDLFGICSASGSKNGKSEIFRQIEVYKKLSVPLLVGHSRKRFLQQFTESPPAERDIETLAISMQIADHINYLRLHNLEITARALKVQRALMCNRFDK